MTGKYRRWEPWTAKEDETLRALWKTTQDMDIAPMFNRSTEEILRRRLALGLKKRSHHTWREWTGREDSMLRTMRRQGSYDWEIAAALDRTRAEVFHRRKALDLPGVSYRGHAPDVCAKIAQAGRQRWEAFRERRQGVGA